MTKYSKITVGILLCALFIFSVKPAGAQTYEEMVKQMQGKFDEFQKNSQEKFDKFVEENDKNFSDFLKNSWEQYALLAGVKIPADPKPKDVPKIDPMEIKKNEVNDIPIIVVEDTIPKEVKKKTVTPTVQKNEDKTFDKLNGQITFYGTELKFSYDKNFVSTFNSVSEAEVADYWSKMSATNHYHFINQMLDYKTGLNLNDWGYFLLVKKASAKICPSSENAANLLTWFVLSKSRYRIKIGFDQNKVVLLIPSASMMYGKPYYTFDNTHYFVLDKDVKNIKTYDQDYPDAVMTIDLNIYNTMAFTTKEAKRNLTFDFNGENLSLTAKYNANNMDFYNDYPQCDINIFFDAAVSPIAKESLLQQLKPMVAGKSEQDAVNLLLRFVQKGFEYKTDPEQFKREKFFFAEESLFYPFCDCEDRAVLFTYLVRELLGLKTVGLGYPGHMSSAVKFNEDVSGDFITYNGEKYLICDATYINAPIGMCMPQFVNTPAKVIENNDDKNQEKQDKIIWGKAQNSGISPASAENNIAFGIAGNAVVTGFIKGEVTVGTSKLKADSTDIVVAKYDKNGNVLWAKKFGGSGNDAGVKVKLDAEENCFVSGLFSNTVKFGTTELTSEDIKGVFMMKLDKNGNVKWASKSEFENIIPTANYIYVSKFDSDGAHLGSILYDENENFNNFGITFDDDNCIVTDHLSSSSLSTTSREFNSMAAFNLGSVWKEENDRLIADNYDKAIAGIFAFIKTVNMNGSSITGKNIQDAFDTYNPNFKKAAPAIYRSIGNIISMDNSGGIITISTKNGMDVEFADLVIKDQTKMKIATYKGGNAQITILSGASMGKSTVRFDLNFLKLLKTTGDFVLDYDQDHSQKTMNLKRDILE